jgi:GNAT superfamily N-acetyltransferase
MNSSIIIRPATGDDCRTLAQFNVQLARETEDKHLDPEVVLRGVRHMLDRPGDGFYRVAEIGGQVVGCLMITFEWSDWRDSYFWWIQSVFVRADHRRRGVFHRLYQHVLLEARSKPDVCGLRLYVEHENRAARHTYEAMGMTPGRYSFYELDWSPRHGE